METRLPDAPYLGRPLPQASAWNDDAEERRLHWGVPPDGWEMPEEGADCRVCVTRLRKEAERRRDAADACEELDRRGRPRKTKVLQTQKMERIAGELSKLEREEEEPLGWDSLRALSPETTLFVAPALPSMWRAVQADAFGGATAEVVGGGAEPAEAAEAAEVAEAGEGAC
eukprot:g348.t1